MAEPFIHLAGVKKAYRTLVEETRSLYIDQSEVVSGSHHSPRAPG